MWWAADLSAYKIKWFESTPRAQTKAFETLERNKLDRDFGKKDQH